MASRVEVVDELPPSGRGKVNWAVMCETARAQPDKWVRTPVPLDRTVAYQIRQGRYASVDADEFDAEAGTVNGESYVFIRLKQRKSRGR